MAASHAQPELDRSVAEFRDPATTAERKGEITRRMFEIAAGLPEGTMKPTDRVSQLSASQKAIYDGVLRMLYGDEQIAHEPCEWARMSEVLAMAEGRHEDAARARRAVTWYTRRLALIRRASSSSAVSQPERRERVGRPREQRHGTRTRSTRAGPSEDDSSGEPPGDLSQFAGRAQDSDSPLQRVHQAALADFTTPEEWAACADIFARRAWMLGFARQVAA